MKLAIVGSRTLTVRHLERFVPANVSEIVSGGALGIDRCAAAFAEARQIPLTEFLPDYERFGRGAPLKRNLQIVDYADEVLVFWDKTSRGSAFVIDACKKAQKPVHVVTAEMLEETDSTP